MLRKKRLDLDFTSLLFYQCTSGEFDIIRDQTVRFRNDFHPPYSPDLAPMDFLIFQEIKRFQSDTELSLKVRSIVLSLISK